MKKLIAGLCLIALVAQSTGSQLPAPPDPWDGVVVDFAATRDVAGSTAWKVMYPGTAPVSSVRIDNRDVLRFPCNFRGTRFERASWDRAMRLDLTTARGVRFRFYSPDVAPVSQFAIYFQSGAGWYGSDFNPEVAGRWTTIEIEKDRMWVEGTPAGWGRISAIRVSGWRGADTDTEFSITDFALLGTDAPVVVLTPPPGGSRGRRPQPAHSVADIARFLDTLGLEWLPVSGEELTPAHLDKRRLVILPLGVQLSRPSTDALQTLANEGRAVVILGGTRQMPVHGKAVRAFREMPDPRAFVKLLEEVAPPLATGIAAERIADIGRVGPYRTLGEAERAIATTDASDEVRAQLRAVQDMADHAGQLAREGKAADVVPLALAARGRMIDVYCAAQRPQPGEFRAFWCHDAFGVRGMNWDEAIRNLAENGFTAILPNMLWGGVAFYESAVLPVAPEVAAKGDQIAACLAACRRYGLQCHVWKVNWYMGGRTPKEFAGRVQSEGRTQVRFSGEPRADWLCPSHPANRQLEIDAMVEVATRYDVDGIHFDYIRYPDADGCFCAGCRERFEVETGEKVSDWPRAIRRDNALLVKWNDFRRANITRVVQAVAERVHASRPRVKISAAVFRHWPADRDNVAQDWKVWCDRGYLDFVCPMDYTPSHAKFESLVSRQLEWAGKVPCYPGIGLSVWPERTDVCGVIEQVSITRRLKTGGFTIFNYADVEAREVVPRCGKGLTRLVATRPAAK